MSIDVKIEQKIDDKGEIRANASKELKKIREEIARNERAARKTLDRIMRDTRKNSISPDDSSSFQLSCRFNGSYPCVVVSISSSACCWSSNSVIETAVRITDRDTELDLYEYQTNVPPRTEKRIFRGNILLAQTQS